MQVKRGIKFRQPATLRPEDINGYKKSLRKCEPTEQLRLNVLKYGRDMTTRIYNSRDDITELHSGTRRASRSSGVKVV